MSNNIINKISSSTRIIITLLIILMLLMAKSLYLILFITVLMSILFLISNEKVNSYVKTLKNSYLFLSIILIAYIIILGKYNVISIVIFSYKLLIITFLIKFLLIYTNFKDMHSGIFTILKPLKTFKIDIEQISLNIVISIWFIINLISSKEKIKSSQTLKNKHKINLKNFILPCFIWATKDIEILQTNLKLKFYKVKVEKLNLLSIILLTIFVLLFIVCFVKEVVM